MSDSKPSTEPQPAPATPVIPLAERGRLLEGQSPEVEKPPVIQDWASI